MICNHVYEHVVDPRACWPRSAGCCAPTAWSTSGLPNRLGLIEPHYKLPFLSWLPTAAADRYVAASGRGDRYHERLRTRAGLRRLCRGLRVWDYTATVLAEPSRFHADDMVPSAGPLGAAVGVEGAEPDHPDLHLGRDQGHRRAARAGHDRRAKAGRRHSPA